MTILAFHPDQQVLKVASAISFRYKKQKQKEEDIFIDVLSDTGVIKWYFISNLDYVRRLSSDRHINIHNN